MANSINRDRGGPDWPLGWIQVVTPGTPVSIMSLVDPSFRDDPSNPTPPSTSAAPVAEYTVRCAQILISGFKPAGSGMDLNAGNLYLMRKAVTGGSGNRTDTGSMVAIIPPGSVSSYPMQALVKDCYSPYRYFLDADNAGDGGLCVIYIY